MSFGVPGLRKYLPPILRDRETAPEAAEPPPARELEGVRTLIVDDNGTNRRILEQHFLRWGLRSRSAEGPEEALEELRKAAAEGDPVEIAVLDRQMPGGDGLELARKIKGDPALRNARLILLSSVDLDEEARDDIGRAIADHLTKPVRPSALLDCIVTALGAALPGRREPGPPHAPEEALMVPGASILLVEDNPVNQEVARAMLEILGHRATVAGDGREAVEAVGGGSYDLILMDCQMPFVDGFEAARAIREREFRRTPIVALTANAMPGTSERCLAAGMDDYLAKPFTLRQLREILERWLPQPRSA